MHSKASGQEIVAIYKRERGRETTSERRRRKTRVKRAERTKREERESNAAMGNLFGKKAEEAPKSKITEQDRAIAVRILGRGR